MGLVIWDAIAPKGPVTRKMFPFDDVIMIKGQALLVEILIYVLQFVRFCWNKKKTLEAVFVGMVVSMAHIS